MINFLVRNGTTISRLLQKHSITDFSNPIRASIIVKHTEFQSKAYFGFPHFVRKGAKHYELSPSLLSSSFCSSSFSKIGFVGWYLGMVKSRPVLTKSVTSALIYTAADLSAQTIVQLGSESAPYDFLRTLRMAGYGMIILGPSLHFWFNFMSKLFPKQDLISTLKKMVMGQSLYGPSMTVVFLTTTAWLNDENSGEIVARLKRDVIPTIINGVMYWPLCDFITYRFTPVHLQPLVSNSFAYLWTIYLTYTASLAKVGQPQS